MVPTQVFFAPGMFSRPDFFQDCATRLQTEGIITSIGHTRTTGSKSPGNPTIADNVTQYRADITKFVDDAGEAEVIIVMHSAAGHFCSGALKDLAVNQRQASGKIGGIKHLIFISAIIVEEGDPEDATPRGISVDYLADAGVLYIENGQTFIKNGVETFFNDLPYEQALEYTAKLCSEPREGWDRPIVYMGWRSIPSHYIICEKDQMIPPIMQKGFSRLAGSTAVRIDAGHFPQLSKCDELVRIILELASDKV
ncbi:Alpha/beta hydrolase fold-1 [Xylariales sp. PMI_506]|nr:Alpha/beta hydrolase fold-1 [Xylariales sp. PMI_506]